MSIARPAKFAHVVYRTHRFEEMLRWYETVFDARILHQNPVMAFMTYDDEHHRMAFLDMSVLQPGAAAKDKDDAVGVDHVAYTYGSLADLIENYALLKAEGIVPYWCIHHGLTISMYYADPDANQMEFQVDALPSSQESIEFMATRFSANPVGVEYDPDELLERYRAGTPEPELLAFYDGGQVSPIRGAVANWISAVG